MKARYEVQPKSPIKIITYHFKNHPKIYRHWHEYLEIIFIENGTFELKSDSKIFKAETGDTVIFNPFEVHESLSLSENNEYFVFCLPPEFIYSVSGVENYIYKNVITGDNEVSSLLRKACQATLMDEHCAGYLLNSEIFSLLYLLSNNYSVKHTRVIKEIGTVEDLVRDVKNRISYCYAESLDVVSLADAFHVSPSHLQHSFKKYNGKTVIEYINQTRIDHAKELLKTSTMRISDVAGSVGFADYNYFSRVFKKYCGLSPREYREKLK